MAGHAKLIRAGQFAQVARQGAIIFVALALPRLGVSRAVIGEWEGLLYVGAILGFGWLTGLSQAYLTTVRGVPNGLAYSRKVFCSVLAVAAFLLLLAAGLHDWLYYLLRLGSPPAGWWFFFVFLLVQWPAIFFEQTLQVRNKPWALVAFSGFSSLGYVLAVVLPIYFGGGLPEALYWLALYAGGKLLVMVAGLLLLKAEGARPQVPGDGKGELRQLWRTAQPLIFYTTIGYLVVAFDPWFVNYWYEDDEGLFAIFRYGAREIPFVAAVTNGMVVVLLPLLTEDLGGGLDQLRASSRRLFHYIFLGVIALMLTAPFWWVPLFTEMFAEGLPLFRLYLFIIVSRLLFPMPIIVALGHTRGLWLFSFSELLSNIALSFLLVPLLGLPGVIISTVIADILNKAILMHYLWRKRRITPGRYMDLRLFLVYCGLLTVSYFLT